MEDEAEKLKQLQTEVDKQLNVPTSPNAASAGPILSFEEKMEIDARSVYVGMKIQKIQMIVSLVPYQNHKLNFFRAEKRIFILIFYAFLKKFNSLELGHV